MDPKAPYVASLVLPCAHPANAHEDVEQQRLLLAGSPSSQTVVVSLDLLHSTDTAGYTLTLSGPFEDVLAARQALLHRATRNVSLSRPVWSMHLLTTFHRRV